MGIFIGGFIFIHPERSGMKIHQQIKRMGRIGLSGGGEGFTRERKQSKGRGV